MEEAVIYQRATGQTLGPGSYGWRSSKLYPAPSVGCPISFALSLTGEPRFRKLHFGMASVCDSTSLR